MNKLLRKLAPVFVVLIFVGLASADNFKSLTVTLGSSPQTIHLHGDDFIVIRNFTQDGFTTTRGTISVAKPPTANAITVLSAAIVDDTTNPPEVINSIVIAGAADVLINCPDPAATCFVSYKKENN